MKIAPIVVILAALSPLTHADDYPIKGPHFDTAKYVIKSVTSEGSERTVLIQRSGPYFSTFIKQKYNCLNSEYRHIGAGMDYEKITEDPSDSGWLRLLSGDWCMAVKNYVCLDSDNKTAAN